MTPLHLLPRGLLRRPCVFLAALLACYLLLGQTRAAAQEPDVEVHGRSGGSIQRYGGDVLYFVTLPISNATLEVHTFDAPGDLRSWFLVSYDKTSPTSFQYANTVTNRLYPFERKIGLHNTLTLFFRIAIKLIQAQNQYMLFARALKTGDKAPVLLRLVPEGTQTQGQPPPGGASAFLTVTDPGGPAFVLKGGLPKLSLHQALDNGIKKTVLQFPLYYKNSDFLLATGSSTLYFVSDNILSVDDRDKAAKITAAVGLTTNALSPGSPVPTTLSTEFNVQSSQSGRNQSFGLGETLERSLPELLSASRGNLLVPGAAPVLQFTPLQYERRFKRDTGVSPGHTQTNLLLISAGIGWTPIYLFSGRNANTRDDLFLDLQAKAWYFPNERATAGYSVHRFEQNLSASLNLPVRFLPVRSFFTVSYTHGANPANGFATSSTFQVLYTIVNVPIMLH